MFGDDAFCNVTERGHFEPRIMTQRCERREGGRGAIGTSITELTPGAARLVEIDKRMDRGKVIDVFRNRGEIRGLSSRIARTLRDAPFGDHDRDVRMRARGP